ncbi:MAG: hypothetical protein DRJ03_18785, partial [Chloroflexi bacterium]
TTRPRRSLESAFAGKNGRNLSNFATNVTFRDLRGLKFGSTDTGYALGQQIKALPLAAKPKR